ncbi:MAG: TIM barrel protein [Verrucomicrobiota bacterium]|nr:TIM barrel protein [Limisphaera sp.]MDW8382908.1 TIM barrel protein [Verrucomicrobiota bacterium]
MKTHTYRFCFGPWNISEGQDPYGPPVRSPKTLEWKMQALKRMGFDAMMFHDDDAVPEIDQKPETQVRKEARELRCKLGDAGIAVEMVAPRLWFDPRTVDGAFTSNDSKCRTYAIERSLRCIDLARELGTDLVVLWLAREGTYLRESKNARRCVDLLVEALNRMLAHDSKIRIAIEPKPNEPMDQAYIPTIGHAIALASLTADPSRVGCLMESAHAILAGLDPADEIDFACAFGKLWSIDLNDQNGLKFDQDKPFGSANLRVAFNQVRALERNRYG